MTWKREPHRHLKEEHGGQKKVRAQAPTPSKSHISGYFNIWVQQGFFPSPFLTPLTEMDTILSEPQKFPLFNAKPSNKDNLLSLSRIV